MHNDDLYSAKSHVKTYIKMSPEAPHQPFALCTLPEKTWEGCIDVIFFLLSLRQFFLSIVFLLDK